MLENGTSWLNNEVLEKLRTCLSLMSSVGRGSNADVSLRTMIRFKIRILRYFVSLVQIGRLM